MPYIYNQPHGKIDDSVKKIDQVNSRKLSEKYYKRENRRPTHRKLSSDSPRFNQIFGKDIIQAPELVDLKYGNNKLCYDFFDCLRNKLEENPNHIYISFKETKVLKAMPMLMLYSIIDEAREINGCITSIGIIWSKSSTRINSIIRNSGSFLRASERETMMSDAITMPVIMGDNSRVLSLQERIIDFILDDEYYIDISAEREQEISSAIQETVDNVGRHAYPDMKDHKDKKWWICCDRIGDNLFIVIYDSGIGIPSSLSENNAVLLERVNRLYPEQCKAQPKESIEDDSKTRIVQAIINVKLLRKRLSDGQLIRAAMHVDVTSTELTQHGQGSKSIKGLITADENSFLLMYSNYGFYRYSNNDEDNEQSVRNSEYKIPGTLIQWSI